MSGRKKARARKPAKPGARPHPRITQRVSSYLATVCSIAHDVLDQCEHEHTLGDETHPGETAKLRRIVDRLHEASGRGPYRQIDWRIGSVDGKPNARVPRYASRLSSSLGANQ